MSDSASKPSAAADVDPAAEAARYALLRRLAPSMRHHLVVNLQPIGMVYEIMDRRLRAPEPDLADVREGAHKISGYARAALASCVDVVTWLAPDNEARCTAAQGVAECLSLIATSFTFRGFSLRDDGGEAPGEVNRGAFRNVVTGALMWLTDDDAPPAQISIRSEATEGGLLLAIDLRPSDGPAGFATAPTYRPLTFEDVQALARADGVQLERDGSSLRITLPWCSARA